MYKSVLLILWLTCLYYSGSSQESRTTFYIATENFRKEIGWGGMEGLLEQHGKAGGSEGSTASSCYPSDWRNKGKLRFSNPEAWMRDFGTEEGWKGWDSLGCWYLWVLSHKASSRSAESNWVLEMIAAIRVKNPVHLSYRNSHWNHLWVFVLWIDMLKECVNSFLNFIVQFLRASLSSSIKWGQQSLLFSSWWCLWNVKSY